MLTCVDMCCPIGKNMEKYGRRGEGADGMPVSDADDEGGEGRRKTVLMGRISDVSRIRISKNRVFSD